MDADGFDEDQVDNRSIESFDTAYWHAWCCRGPASVQGQASTSTNTNTSAMVYRYPVSTRLEFPLQDDEPEAMTNIEYGQPPVAHFTDNSATVSTSSSTGSHHEHELRLIICGYRWEASSIMSTFSHEASDLDDNNVASFALLDTLTRWLPLWKGGTLHVRSNDISVLRGIRGAYSDSGVWHTVRSLCGQYGVELSAKTVERRSPENLYARGNTRDDKCAAGTLRTTLRHPEIVDAAVRWLMASEQRGRTDYPTMLSHLRL